MASDSNRTRIDEFFPARKRKPTSPAVKSERVIKDARTSVNGSPGSKGNLDGYLVSSQNENAKVVSSRQPHIKKNLSLGIKKSSQFEQKHDLPSKSSQLDEGLSRVSEKVLEVPREENAGSRPGEHNPELKKFAADFLSLYCSEVPSNVSSSSELKFNGQKRDGSPSLLVANDDKKQCIAHYDQRPLEGAVACSSQESDELNSEFTSRVREVVFSTSKKLGGTSDNNPSKLQAGLIKCNKTSASPAGVDCYTPGSSASKLLIRETPKSGHGSSFFSPGESFWNEAIDIVDGLSLPMGAFSAHSAQEVNVHKGLCEQKTPCNSESGKHGDRLEDRLAEGGKLSSHLELKAPVGSMGVKGKQTMEFASVPDKKVSPLPIRHFDFLHEDKNLDRKILHQAPIDNTREDCANEGGRYESDSLSRKGSCTNNILSCCGKTDDGRMYPPENKLRSSVLSLSSMDLVVRSSSVGGIQATDPLKVASEVRVVSHCRLNDSSTSRVQEEVMRSPANPQKIDEAGSPSNSGTPSSSIPLQEYLHLTRWLPPEICTVYQKRGITKLYPWQVECLKVDGVLQKRNLVYCASTSAGKSFVAEILMLRRVIYTGKMAILVLPYVSICAEKAEHLEALLEPLGKHVRSFYGNQGGGTLPKDTSVAVCTIEKANSLINRLLEEGRLSELGIIVIDELHMVGDQHRGYLLELMLTKLRYAAGEGNVESSGDESSGTSSGKADPAHGLQIVGMSATMPNVGSVADWLQAALYQTNFRPVPLEEYIKIGNSIFNKKMELVRTIPKAADLGGKDPDHIAELCNEVVQEGHSVLIFCSSRKGCESTARHVSKFTKRFSVSTRDDQIEFSDIHSAIDALRRCPVGLDPILEETLPSGVAYHHAGLTVEEREIVETCYRKGLLRVLTATSTLAAGVNLPARRVIFRQPRIGRDFIDGTRYRQMAGRAGRTGIDTKGESVLICKQEEVKRITAILNDSCPPLQSCLSEDKNGMTHAILEVVAGSIVQTAGDIHRYVRCTLLNSTKPFEDVVKSAQDSLRWLCHRKFLEWNEETKLYSTTPLGRASFGSSLSPEESLVVLDDLSRAREGFVLASDLHLVYLVTPINVEVEPDWELFYQRFMQLSVLEQSVGNRVGVAEPFLMRMAHGAPVHMLIRSRDSKRGLNDKLQNRNSSGNNNASSNEQTLRVCKRFYVALMLSRLVQEAPVADVCEAFKVARGMVQALQENAGRFASMVSLFCERLGWHDLEGLVAKFQNRVSFGVRAEIVELTTIPYVKGSRARALYKSGLRTPLAVAEASIPEIAKALFESSSWVGQEGSAQRRVQLGVAKKIKNGARKLVLEKAEEARVAAFSAFKSLGLDVSQFSRPLSVTAATNPIMKESSKTSSGENTTGSFVGKESMGNFPAKITTAEGNANSESLVPLHQLEGENLKISKINYEAPVEVNSNAAMQGTSYTDEVGVPLDNNCKLSSHHTESYGLAVTTLVGSAGDENCISDSSLNHGQKEGSNGGVACDSRNDNICVKGPMNASNMDGGFDSFLDLWDSVKGFCFDIHFTKRSELNSLIPFEIHGMAICWEKSPVYYVNLSKDLMGSSKLNIESQQEYFSRGTMDDTGKADPNHRWEKARHRWHRISKIMARSSVRKISWSLKVQVQVLKNPGVPAQRFGGLNFAKNCMDIQLIDNSHFSLPSIHVQDGIDMSIVAWLLWPDEERSSNPTLEKEVKKRLSSEAAAAANRRGRWKNQMRRAAHNGCCRRVAQIRALGSALWKLLISENLIEALVNTENPLVNILADMEIWGIGIDMEKCLRARHLLGKKLKELEKEAYRLAGKNFSLHTSADVADVLYRHLNLPKPAGHNKGKQHPSTDKHALDLLRHQHPIVSVIKEHRTLAKLLNSTLGSICSQSRLSMRSQRYTLHGHWLQTSTATGRLSMEEPNLQCVEHALRLELNHTDENTSHANDNEHVINARDFFIPTQENWLLLTADYSQIELRLMAHFSKDSSLVELLSKRSGDVFTMIAARWTDQQESTVSSQERDQTKKMVYGILYGMGANTLAEQLGCSSDEATEKIQSFKSSFPGVASWLKEAVKSCRTKGHIETLMGRKRFLSKIKFGNSEEKGKAQRQAVNSICQGSAADIIKIAMINIHSVIVEGCEKLDGKTKFGTRFSRLRGHCRLLLQVHDELVLEVDSSVVREAALFLQMSMESATSLLVPLHANLKIGKTWGTLEPFVADDYKDVTVDGQVANFSVDRGQ